MILNGFSEPGCRITEREMPIDQNLKEYRHATLGNIIKGSKYFVRKSNNRMLGPKRMENCLNIVQSSNLFLCIDLRHICLYHVIYNVAS